MEEKATLILVDFQKDFISGTLAVKGAEFALENTLKLLESGKIERVIFTLDWHPYDHCSFKENGGKWPAHCVEHTEGALPELLLLNCCMQHNIPYEFSLKGISSYGEEYGAFSGFEEGKWSYSDDRGLTIFKEEKLVICGIAGDYCVLETIKNMKPVWHRLSTFIPGITSIDGGVKLDKFIKENSLKIINSL